MKTMLRASATLALAVLPGALFGQAAPAPEPQQAPAAPAAQQPAPAAPDADPALWVVKDEDTTIYLFGTVHVLKPGLSWFDDGVRAAFDASDEIVLEMVMPDDQAMQGLVQRLAISPTGPPLTEKLPADKRGAYAKALTDLGMPANAFDRVKPWFAATVLSIQPMMKLGYNPQEGAEMKVTEAAKAANKPVSGLETAEQQLGFFDALSEPAQITMLTSTVDQIATLPTMVDTMVSAWSAGDPDRLAAVMNDGLRDSPEVAKALLADRNERWAGWIAQRLARPGTVFMAVGAGHLAGPDSVQAKLAQRKLAAGRVAY